jgi:hypothetical protein
VELVVKLVTSQAVAHVKQAFSKMEIIVLYLLVVVVVLELLASQEKAAGLTVLWVVKLVISIQTQMYFACKLMQDMYWSLEVYLSVTLHVKLALISKTTESTALV